MAATQNLVPEHRAHTAASNQERKVLIAKPSLWTKHKCLPFHDMVSSRQRGALPSPPWILSLSTVNMPRLAPALLFLEDGATFHFPLAPQTQLSARGMQDTLMITE